MDIHRRWKFGGEGMTEGYGFNCCEKPSTCLVMSIDILDRTYTKPMRKCLTCGAKWEEKGDEQ